MKKIILFSLFIPLFLFAQEEQDKCDKEVEAKCDPNLAVYDCIMDGLKEKKNFFTKECMPKVLEKMQAGKYPDPCLQEQQRLCPPGSPPNCAAVNRNSMSSDCQEKITEDGGLKIPDEEEIKKIQEGCKGLIIIECGPLEIDMQMALNEGKMSQAKDLTKKYQECIKKAMKNPKDDKCKEMLKDYGESQKKK